MPWNPADAKRHTHKASSPRLERMWANVANSALTRTKDEATAIREANAVVNRSATKLIKARKRK